LAGEPRPPLADGRQRHPQPPGNGTVVFARRAAQHNPRPQRRRLRPFGASRPLLENLTFLFTQNNNSGWTTDRHARLPLYRRRICVKLYSTLFPTLDTSAPSAV